MSLFTLYEKVHLWAKYSASGASECFFVAEDLDGPDVAFVVNLSLNIDEDEFEVIYVCHSRTLFLRNLRGKGSSVQIQKVRIVGGNGETV